MTMVQVLEVVSPVPSETLLTAISLDATPLPQLMHDGGKRLELFCRGESNDPRFCLELFRRALDAHDQEAWHGLVDLFQPLLLARLRRLEIVPELAEEAVQE